MLATRPLPTASVERRAGWPMTPRVDPINYGGHWFSHRARLAGEGPTPVTGCCRPARSSCPGCLALFPAAVEPVVLPPTAADGGCRGVATQHQPSAAPWSGSAWCSRWWPSWQRLRKPWKLALALGVLFLDQMCELVWSSRRASRFIEVQPWVKS